MYVYIKHLFSILTEASKVNEHKVLFIAMGSQEGPREGKEDVGAERKEGGTEGGGKEGRDQKRERSNN